MWSFPEQRLWLIVMVEKSQFAQWLAYSYGEQQQQKSYNLVL